MRPPPLWSRASRARRWAGAALSCVFVAACAGLPSPPQFDAEAIERHIAFLADDAREGRDAGSEGSRQAERYIAEELRQAGLDAVEEQPFEFVAGAETWLAMTSGTPASLPAGAPKMLP